MGRTNADFGQGADRPVYNGDGLADPRKGARWRTHALTEREQTEDVKSEPGAAWGNNVALIPVHQIARYREFDREGRHGHDDSTENIANITEDLKKGGVAALREPVTLLYNHKEKWGYLGEGHHRVAAAIKAGLTHIPVQIGRGWGDVKDNKQMGRGAPLHLDNRVVEPGNGGYYPAYMHPGNFQEFEGAR